MNRLGQFGGLVEGTQTVFQEWTSSCDCTVDRVVGRVIRAIDCVPWIATDSKFDPIPDNAQFRDLVSRIGLVAK